MKDKQTDQYAEIIAKRIKELCEKRDISINKLSTLSGIRQSTLQNIVSGNTQNPTIKTMNRIARGLGMTLAELLDLQDFNKFI